MKELKEKETKKMCAGSLSAGAYALIVSISSFFIGIFDGVTRPFKCR